MSTGLPIEKHIPILFETLEKQGANTPLDTPGVLSKELTALVDKSKGAASVHITPKLTARFATAATEIWQRGVHSFLISASLTEASPIWACVSGYYASHYSVRGLAHLLGFFQLRRRARIVSVEFVSGRHVCHIQHSTGTRREHKFYWKAVKDSARFVNDPFFTDNPEYDEDESDVAHRNIANYLDHLNAFPKFQPLNEESLRKRLAVLSGMQLSSVPVPNKAKYPDINSVQLIAYHRIIKFRQLLDSTLGGANKFWNAQRNPPWCTRFLNFQVTEPKFIEAHGEQK